MCASPLSEFFPNFLPAPKWLDLLDSMTLAQGGYFWRYMAALKLKTLDEPDLDLLRKALRDRYRADGGGEFKGNSNPDQYEDLNERIQAFIKGQFEDAAVSNHILRKLFYDTRQVKTAHFNTVNLNAFARYITKDASCDYRSWMERVTAAPDQSTNGSAGKLPDAAVTRTSEASPVQHENAAVLVPTGNGVAGAASKQGVEFPISSQETPLILASGQIVQSANQDGAGSQLADQLPLLTFLHPFLYAALLAGALTFTFVLAFPGYSGYDQLERSNLEILMASFFGFSVFGHLAMGIVPGLLVRWFGNRASGKAYRHSLLFVAPFVFIATFVFRQLFVRDGWLISGRAGTGLFGQPDMETLAHAGSFSLCILLISALVDDNGNASTQARLLRATIVGLLCGMVFWLTYLLYQHLVYNGAIMEDDFIIAASVFNLKFPHHERLPLVVFMAFIQCFLTLVFVGGKFRNRDKESSPSP